MCVYGYHTYNQLFINCQALSTTKLSAVNVKRVSDGQTVAVKEMMKDSIVIFGTYAADFNNVEYAQRLNHYKSRLMESGVQNFHMIMNASPKSCQALSSLLDLDDSINSIVMNLARQQSFWSK